MACRKSPHPNLAQNGRLGWGTRFKRSKLMPRLSTRHQLIARTRGKRDYVSPWWRRNSATASRPM